MGHGGQEGASLSTWGSDPRRSPQRVVVCHPVLMAHVTLVANDLHPLRVLVHHLPCCCGPLLAQSPDVEVLVLHCQPLRLEACSRETARAAAQPAHGHQTSPLLRTPHQPAQRWPQLPPGSQLVPGRTCPCPGQAYGVTKKMHPTLESHKEPKAALLCVCRARWGSSPFPTVPSPSGRITQGTTLLPSIW